MKTSENELPNSIQSIIYIFINIYVHLEGQFYTLIWHIQSIPAHSEKGTNLICSLK
jgi:hypothetical protein